MRRAEPGRDPEADCLLCDQGSEGAAAAQSLPRGDTDPMPIEKPTAERGEGTREVEPESERRRFSGLAAS